MDIVTGNIGWIEVVCGPMFSGKSEELIRRLRRAKIARKRVLYRGLCRNPATQFGLIFTVRFMPGERDHATLR